MKMPLPILLKAIMISLLLMLHYFLPHLDSANAFLLSPQSRFSTFKLDDTLSKLGKRIPLDTILASSSDLSKREKLVQVTEAFRTRQTHWVWLDTLIAYGGGRFLELLFQIDPGLFLQLIERYGVVGVDDLDKEFDAMLPKIESPLKQNLKVEFDVFNTESIFKSLCERSDSFYANPRTAGTMSEVLKRQSDEIMALQLKLLRERGEIDIKLCDTSLDGATREKLREELRITKSRYEELKPKRNELLRDLSKWRLAERIARLLKEKPVSLAVDYGKDGAEISAKGFVVAGDEVPVMFSGLFPRDWPNMKRIIEENKLSGIFFEPSEDEECSREAVVKLLSVLVDEEHEHVDLKKGITLGRRAWARVIEDAGAEEKARLTMTRVDPYDDRLFGEKPVATDTPRKPAIIYVSAFLNQNGSERFPAAEASLKKIVENTIPFFVTEEITAEEALAGLYSWAIDSRIQLPKDGQIPVIIPEESKARVMGAGLPNRAILVMVKEPKLDEVVGYKTYRFLMALLYGRDMDELKNIIVEDDPAQNEKLDGAFNLSNKGTRKITVTPIEVGQGYLTLLNRTQDNISATAAFSNSTLRQSP